VISNEQTADNIRLQVDGDDRLVVRGGGEVDITSGDLDINGNSINNAELDEFSTQSISRITPFYVRGSEVYHGQIVRVGGRDLAQTDRGINLIVLDKSDYSVISNNVYDIYGSDADADSLESKLNNMGSEEIGIMSCYDECTNRIDGGLADAAASKNLFKYSRISDTDAAYAAIFDGDGTNSVEKTAQGGDNDVYISGFLMDGQISTSDRAPSTLSGSDGTPSEALKVDSSGKVDITEGNLNMNSNNVENIDIIDIDSQGYIGISNNQDDPNLEFEGSGIELTGGGLSFGDGPPSSGIDMNGNPIDSAGIIRSEGVDVQETTSSHGGLPSGWYTIAENSGDRASAKFIVKDQEGGEHSAYHFYASHHYGTDNSNTINVLGGSDYGNGCIERLRIQEAGTYDGANLQVYIDSDNCNGVQAFMSENFQNSGWGLVDWASGTTISGLSPQTTVNLDQGPDNSVRFSNGISTQGDIEMNGNGIRNPGSMQVPVGYDAW